MTGDVVLVVDDEPQIHRFLAPVLDAAGYTVLRAMTGTEALRLAAARSPALVLLDLGLPDIDGQAVLGKLRGFSQVPVIVLSARDRAAEKIAALDNGANDYVEKPFDVGELLARIRAALRLSLGHDRVRIFRSGALQVDFMRRLVRVDGAAVTLSPREYELLELLAKSAGRVLTHPRILTAIWGPAHLGDQHYVRVYVGHLRQKLGPAGALLVTEPGVGYRLLADDVGPDHGLLTSQA